MVKKNNAFLLDRYALHQIILFCLDYYLIFYTFLNEIVKKFVYDLCFTVSFSDMQKNTILKDRQNPERRDY